MLRNLNVHNLRLVADVSLEPDAGVNLFVGGNGSGKTTLLEAIYLLAKGRSFRHRETSPLVREGEKDLHLFAEFVDLSGGAHRLGMLREESEWQVRLDGQNARKRSEILALLPVQWIGADPQSLVTGMPEARRGFLDTGLFHVEQRYLGVLHSYNRALEQRNAALRNQASDLDGWDRQLVFFAGQLDEWRRSYVARIAQSVSEILKGWDLDLGLAIRYVRGWKEGDNFGDALSAAAAMDRKRGFTSIGPHRADLSIRTGHTKSGKKLSRGQLKMVAAALYFGQSMLQKANGQGPGVLLFDDLPAELDSLNRERLLDTIVALYDQSFIAALSKDDLPDSCKPAKLFHVEHGAVKAV